MLGFKNRYWLKRSITKLLRLQQFTGGFIQADEGTKPELVFKGKLNALEDILEDYVTG